jgi:hypothetical protein
MLNDKTVEFVRTEEELSSKIQVYGVPLVWVIDGECLYDLPLRVEIAEIFQSLTHVIDVSDEYSDHNGITVKLMKNEEVLEIFQTSEYFGSILLSDPIVLDLSKYAYGMYVQSPNARFDGEKFIILNRDMTGYPEWHPHE